LSTTPPILTERLYEAKPATTAAADCDCPDTSITSSTGKPRRAARSDAAPERPGSPATPSNSPIAPSITTISASLTVSAISVSISCGGMAQVSRLMPLAPVAAA